MVSTPKHRYSWNDIETMCISIVNQMYEDSWTPDYIVGITRGGNVPATIISNMIGIRCETLKVSLRDDDTDNEHNWWMADDAFNGKNILIVDDINDTGATLNWIIKDWDISETFGNNVRFAVLTDNLASKAVQPVSYSCHEINKEESDVWLIYPWEDVGAYNGLSR